MYLKDKIPNSDYEKQKTIKTNLTETIRSYKDTLHKK